MRAVRSDRTPGSAAERKNVTVLFADLVSSLAQLEEDPEQAAELLGTTLARLSAIMRRHGGVVTQAMGDGIMAVFGAPVSSEDHAFDACRAALAVHAHPPDGLAFRVGMCSGIVVMTKGGSNFDYTAFGRPAHVAARLQGMAEPGSTLIAGSTWRQVDRRADAVGLGPRDIRGLDQPIDLFRLTGLSDAPYQMRRVREPLPIFGRDAERRQLDAVAADAMAGSGCTVILTGTAGVGKSRLTEDFAKRQQQQGWRTLRAFGVAQAERKPYAGIAQAIADCLFLQGTDPDREDLRAVIMTRLADLGCDSDETARAILSLYGIADASWSEVPPQARKAELTQAVFLIVQAESRRQPVLIALDDMQWVDTYSRDLLLGVAARIGDLRAVLLANFRLETPVDWPNAIPAIYIELAPLSGAGADSFLDALLGRDPSLRQLRTALLSRTAGVPFFLEEFVREMRDSGGLAGNTGDHRLERPTDTVELPLTVHDVVAARIDRLAPWDRWLLRASAVLGQKGETAVLARMGGPTGQPFRETFRRLVDAEFLAPDPETSDQYTFRHPVTHEVTYRALIAKERRAFHTAALDALKGAFPAGGDGMDERLGFHAEHAGLSIEAAQHLISAGTRVIPGAAAEHAIWCLEHATTLLADTSDSEAGRKLEIDARLKLRNALLPVGRHDEIPQHMERAWSLCRGPEDEASKIRINSHLCHYFWLAGKFETSLGYGRRALAAAQAHGDDALIVPTRTVVGFTLHSMGQFREVVNVFAENVRLLTGPKAAERFGFVALPSVVSRGYLAWAMAEQGAFDKAYPFALSARDIADEVGRPFDRVQGCLAMAHVLLLAGRADEALNHLTTADAICREAKVALLMPRVAALIGYAHALLGQMPQALDHAERALERVEAINLVAMRTPCLVWAGGVQLMAGNPDRALAIAEGLRKSCRDSGEEGYGAWAQYLYATALFDSSRSVQGLDAIATAGKMALDLGMQPLFAHTIRAEGQMKKELGQTEQANELIARAQKRYRHLSMDYWIDRQTSSLVHGD